MIFSLFSYYLLCPTPTTDMKHTNDQLHIDNNALASTMDAFARPQKHV